MREQNLSHSDSSLSEDFRPHQDHLRLPDGRKRLKLKK